MISDEKLDRREKKMRLPLKIAILGCGGMGSGHALAISGKSEERPDFTSYGVYQRGQIEVAPLAGKLELAGVYDVDKKRMEWVKEQGWHCYASYEDMLQDGGVDIILIATPNHLHKQQAMQAMRAGKHVLCEKPVMMTSSDLEEVMEVAKKTGMVFYPRQNRRWDYDFLVAKKILDSHMLGEVFYIESSNVGSRGIPGDWRRFKKFGGGMMLDWGVHLLDRILCMIPGKIRTVSCHCSYVTGEECEDGFQAFLDFESGVRVQVHVGTCHFIGKPVWYLAGKEGTAEIRNFLGEGKVVRMTQWQEEGIKPVLAGEGLTKTMAPRDEKTTQVCELPQVIVDRNGLYLNLVDTICGIAEPLVTPEQALRVLRLMERLMEASRENKILFFEE